jgi:hypothetical protein
VTRRVAILVTGSRDWTDIVALSRALYEIMPVRGSGAFVLVIHGGARGADHIAADSAVRLGFETLEMPAQWDRDGKSAGHKRNAAMVRVLEALHDCGYECHVLAFPMPDSKGTWDCVRRAKAGGFQPRVIGPHARPAAKGAP